jgi:hypothetical protein
MIPIWLKIAYTALVAVIVILYWGRYGPGNFLWFSDVALLAMVPALWLESNVLVSAMAVGVLVPELFWNVAYAARLLTGRRLTGLVDYMFDPALPRWLRALSYFHVVLPPLMLWALSRLGYSDSALPLQTGIGWTVLVVTYAITDPKKNVNWVFGFGGEGSTTRLRPLVYLGALMLGFLVLLWVPTHFVLRAIFPPAP